MRHADRPRAGRPFAALALVAAASLSQGSAAGAEPAAPDGDPPQPPTLSADEAKALARLRRPPRGYARAYGAVAVGKGMRFNNPYRLETQLGDDAESLSLTASYLDFSIGLSFGEPDGLQHGGSMHYTTAIQGVGQQIITPSYVALYRGPHPFMLLGRVGVPVILTPDINAGGELAVGGAYFLSGSLGLTAELIGDIFYGAATPEREISTIPILSAQIGLMVDYEILP